MPGVLQTDKLKHVYGSDSLPPLFLIDSEVLKEPPGLYGYRWRRRAFLPAVSVPHLVRYNIPVVSGKEAAMKNETKGALLTLAGGTCWGLSGSMGQFLFQHEHMETRWLVPIRLGMAGIILFLYCLRKYGRFTFAPWQDRKDRRDLLVYGLLGVSCCQYLYFLTIQLSSAGIATILQDLSPVMILIVTCFLSRRRPRPYEVLSILLALAGVLLITTHGDFTRFAIPAAALGTGVLSALCVTVYNMVPHDLLKKYPVVLLQSWAFLMGSAMFLLLFQPWRTAYVPTLVGWFGIAFVVLVGNVTAFTWYMSGVALIGPEKGILYGFAEPVVAALITVLFLHSSFTLADGFGFAAVFAMLLLISAGSRNLRKESDHE